MEGRIAEFRRSGGSIVELSVAGGDSIIDISDYEIAESSSMDELAIIFSTNSATQGVRHSVCMIGGAKPGVAAAAPKFFVSPEGCVLCTLSSSYRFEGLSSEDVGDMRRSVVFTEVIQDASMVTTFIADIVRVDAD